MPDFRSEFFSVKTHFDLLANLCRWAAGDEHGFVFMGSGWCFNANDIIAVAGVGNTQHHQEPRELAHLEMENSGMWHTVHLAYDLKNQLDHKPCDKPDSIGFGLASINRPEAVLVVYKTGIEVHTSVHAPIEIFDAISGQGPVQRSEVSVIAPATNTNFEAYRKTFDRVMDELRSGNVYQINYCHELSCQAAIENPVELFIEGLKTNYSPFSAFYRRGKSYALCYSPERFLHFKGRKVTAQPMKGTTPRGKDPNEDKRLKDALRQSEKDRRENVMIVDMVRNDLSHCALPGTVEVPDLYRIASYPKVHQMFSTITATLQPGTPYLHALIKAFPMASMTGAPKINAMRLIDELETQRRGLFSGTLGFITPWGEADFNVVIRTLLYNASNQTVSIQAGGGITIMSNVEDEWNESLLKMNHLRQLLGLAADR
ncbi:MAG: anthranilate synthase component I family protein [Salibacteraceae bacterium]